MNFQKHYCRNITGQTQLIMTRLPAWFLRAWLVRAAKWSQVMQNIPESCKTSRTSQTSERENIATAGGRARSEWNRHDMTLGDSLLYGITPLFRGWRKNHDQEE